MRQIFLDTETTGLEVERGHRIVEVVALTYPDRRTNAFESIHFFCNPHRAIDADAKKVHGISDEFLADKPDFSEIAEQLQNFLQGGEVIIHNAAFDKGFLNSEFKICGMPPLEDICKITCSLEMSRLKNQGLRHHRLEDLCKHFGVDDSERTTHSALLDARLLAQVYFAMTREQIAMSMSRGAKAKDILQARKIISRAPSATELAAHELFLDAMEKDTGIKPLWRR